MPRAFAAKEEPSSEPGALLALVEEGSSLVLVRPLPGARRLVMLVSILPVLALVPAALGASFVVANSVGIDFFIAFLLCIAGIFAAVISLSGPLNSWTVRYLAEHPMVKTYLAVRAVRPRSLLWHEIHAIADGREIVLAVRGDWSAIEKTLAATGFTAKKQRKGG